MQRVLQIGAGNIGRGCVARIFSENKYEINFADVNVEIIDKLQATNNYKIEIVQDEIETQEIRYNNVIYSTDTDSFNTLFSKMNVVTTAVGPAILPFVAKNIAQAIKEKYLKNDRKNITIIACENYIKASSYLKTLVYTELQEAEIIFADGCLVFADAAIDCIVPPVTDTKGLMVRVELFYELVVDKTHIVDEALLASPNIIFTTTILAFVERKLFTLNAAHATCAYLGYYQGYTHIDAAIADPQIHTFIQSLMEKNAEILCKKHGFDIEKQLQYVAKIMKRFENPYLQDDVTRVGRELLRKINTNERLVAPIKDGLKLKVDCEILYQAVAIALHYINDHEMDTIVIQRLFNTRGKNETVSYLTGLRDYEAVTQIAADYDKISKEGITWIFQS